MTVVADDISIVGGVVTIRGLKFTVELLEAISDGSMHGWFKFIPGSAGARHIQSVSPEIERKIESLVQREMALRN